MHGIVSDAALDILFRTARCHRAWLDRPVSDTLLRAAWELVKLGPFLEAGGGSSRILFVRSAETKRRVGAGLPDEERAAAVSAPVLALVASDLAAPVPGAANADAHQRALAARGGAVRGAYLLLAVRSLGLDCRPIWNFDPEAIAAALDPERGALPSFLCAIGYGDDAQTEPIRSPLGFDEACRIL
jgi:3-hydroxypropanoate dehydrogenase